MQRGEFVFHHELRGWVRLDVPELRPGALVLLRYCFGKIDALPPRIPYVFDSCLWCGGDLSAPDQGEGAEC